MNLILNPTLRLDGFMTVAVRRRGIIQKALPLELFERLLKGIHRGRFSRAIIPALVREGILIPRRAAPRRVKLRSELGGSSRLLPRYPRLQEPADRGDLAVNPGAWLLPGRSPRWLRQRIAGQRAVSTEGPTLWVRDPGTLMLWPYPVPAKRLKEIRAVLGGRLRPHQLGLASRRDLIRSGVLISRGEARQLRVQRRSALREARQSLRRNEYVVLRELLTPRRVALLRSYCRELEREGFMRHGDPQVEKRYVAHNDKVARFVHSELARLVSRVTPRPVKASYSYLAVYKPGAELERHRDRPQCEWNLSMVWDAQPETPPSKAWPLYLETPRGARAVRLGIGDAVLYRGTDLFHWRPAQPEGHQIAACFFHFVNLDFDGPLD